MEIYTLEDRVTENGITKITEHKYEHIDAAKLYVYQFCFAWKNNVKATAAKSFTETEWKYENNQWQKICNIVEKNNSHCEHIFTIKSNYCYL